MSTWKYPKLQQPLASLEFQVQEPGEVARWCQIMGNGGIVGGAIPNSARAFDQCLARVRLMAERGDLAEHVPVEEPGRSFRLVPLHPETKVLGYRKR